MNNSSAVNSSPPSREGITVMGIYVLQGRERKKNSKKKKLSIFLNFGEKSAY